MTTTQQQLTDAFEKFVEGLPAYGEQATETTRRLSGAYLDSYEKAANSVASFEEKIGAASRNDWLAAVTSAHAALTRDLAQASTAPARRLLG